VPTGKFDIQRIPRIDHNDLENNGILTHAQLEAMLSNLNTDTSLELMGRITSVNLLQLIIYLKYKFSDIDEYLINEMTIIPGITDDKFIDYGSSSTYIDTTNNCILGLPVDSSDTYFYTGIFAIESPVSKILLSSNHSTPPGSSITFGITDSYSTDFENDYQVISPDEITDVDLSSSKIRIGAKLSYGGPPTPYDPYADIYYDIIDFTFTNEDATGDFHFRIRFFDDAALTSLAYEAFSLNDQEGWIIDDTDSIPESGYEVSSSQSIIVSYYPTGDNLVFNKTYYIVIDVWDGSGFVDVSDAYEFVLTGGSNICDLRGDLPRISNFALFFETEDGDQITLNI
jgi:hypothetical protein